MTAVRVAILLAAAAALACADPAPEPLAEPSGSASPDEAGKFRGRAYERNFVFAAVTGDSVFLVPWLMETTTKPGTVVREARGWLARSGTWDAFYTERWETPPTRSPARILPHGSLRLVVREGDALDGIIFDEGPRNLELAFGNVLATWGGPRGETIDLLDGAAYISDRRVGGLIMDMARASAGDAVPGGDWAFLTSGDSLQLVLAADREHAPDGSSGYRGWARLDFRDLQWPELTVEWTETRAFQPARRDVPVSWSITSPDGDFQVTIEARSGEILAGEGAGPLLPVLALFEVAGEASTEGRSFPVRGLFVHERR